MNLTPLFAESRNVRFSRPPKTMTVSLQEKVTVMSAVIDALPSSDPLRAGRALRWCMDSFRLWWRAPWKLLVLAVAIFAVEGLLQLVPWVGVTLSKVVVPMLTLGFILGLDALVRSGSVRWASLFDAFRGGRPWRALLLSLLWGGSVFALQQVCTALRMVGQRWTRSGLGMSWRTASC